MQKIERNKDLRLRTLDRRLWQDDKAVRNYRIPTSEWHCFERLHQWDYYDDGYYDYDVIVLYHQKLLPVIEYNEPYMVLVVNKFVAKDFYGNMLPRWDMYLSKRFAQS